MGLFGNSPGRPLKERPELIFFDYDGNELAVNDLVVVLDKSRHTDVFAYGIIKKLNLYQCTLQIIWNVDTEDCFTEIRRKKYNHIVKVRYPEKRHFDLVHKIMTCTNNIEADMYKPTKDRKPKQELTDQM